MDFTERQLESEILYQGRIITVRRDRALLPNGKTAVREVCEHCGGVGVLPVDENGCAVMVRQYRYPYGEELLEIPAGKMDHGAEDHLACGARELSEETGLCADEMRYLGCVYPSPGFLTEVLHLYLATGLRPCPGVPDEDEFLAVERIPLAVLAEKIASGEVRDAKTVAAFGKMLLIRPDLADKILPMTGGGVK